MTDVPPEIANLREYSDFHDGAEPFVPLADAEAAVLACEQRMRDQAADELTMEVAERVRQRTVVEIVEALREEARALGLSIVGAKRSGAPMPSSPVSAAGALALAKMIESRFGREEGEGDGA